MPIFQKHALGCSCNIPYYMINQSWLSVCSVRRFEHVYIVTKWLRTMNLAIESTEKVSLQQEKQ